MSRNPATSESGGAVLARLHAALDSVELTAELMSDLQSLRPALGPREASLHRVTQLIEEARAVLARMIRTPSANGS